MPTRSRRPISPLLRVLPEGRPRSSTLAVPSRFTRLAFPLFLACAASLALPLAGCASHDREAEELQARVERWMNQYDARYQKLYAADSDAEWRLNTHIVEGDDTNAARSREAKAALAAFAGSTDNIDRIRLFLSLRRHLLPLQARRLETMLFEAADKPQTVPEVVRERIAAETAQTEALYGYTFRIDGKAVTPNEIDATLRESTDLGQRRKAWEASKAVGPTLRDGIVKLRDLRNRTVQALGYDDFFQYQVSEYGMSTDEMLDLCESLVQELRPLYRELHTWVRYELAKRYHRPVPDLIPADWLPNRWAQDWSPLVEVEGRNVEEALAPKSAAWIVKQAEDFYRSLGFAALPDSFWEKSSLYPLPADAPYKKNTHASAWHIDLDHDVRSLMSVEPDPYWYETVHHEMGHIYYFLTYSTPEVPLVLRKGANRAYHEGLGSLMGLAALQRRFLVDRGLLDPAVDVDLSQSLLKEALNYVVFMPFSAGVMTGFEHALYSQDLPPDRFNATWWNLVRRYQGVVPPASRGEEWADALTKTHINNDPAQYYDYALSFVLLFQLHEHIAREILHQDPHDTDYYGSLETGRFLRDLMAPGASRPWREVLRETTGEDLNAGAMLAYFRPLLDWLREQNAGRAYTLPEL